MPSMELPRKLLPFVKTPKRYKIAIGGRGSGKSMSFADLCLMDAQTKQLKTACFREYQNSIDDSVHALLSAEVNRLELQGFDCQQSKILYEGNEMFKFRGLARNPEGIKSMHGFKRFWVEEAQTISFASLKALTPTLREADSEIWMSANPGSRADPFSQRFVIPYERQLTKDGYYEDDLHLIVKINYHDNPFFPDVLEQERQRDEKNLSKALYRHIWEGDFYDEVEDCIIPVEWFDAAIDAHIKLGFKGEGAIVASHDPSDLGPDPKGFALRHGSVFLDVREEVIGDVNEGLDWALDMAFKANADWFVWDGDGMGAPLKRDVDKALSGKKMDYYMFKGSEGVEDPDLPYIDVNNSQNRKTNKESFYNKRAQYAGRLRDRFYLTYRAVVKKEYIDPDQLISLSSDIEYIDSVRAQVCRVPQKRNNNGKFQVVSKKDMIGPVYQLPSPNMFDCMMMSMYQPKAAIEPVEMNFVGWS